MAIVAFRWLVLLAAGAVAGLATAAGLLAGAGVLALAKPAGTVRRFAPVSIGHIL